MRHRVTFEPLVASEDSTGAPYEAYSAATAITVWGEVEYLTGRELWQAQQANSEAQGRVTIRHNANIVPTMRVNFGGTYLRILSVLPDQKKVSQEILFKEWQDR